MSFCLFGGQFGRTELHFSLLNFLLKCFAGEMFFNGHETLMMCDLDALEWKRTKFKSIRVPCVYSLFGDKFGMPKLHFSLLKFLPKHFTGETLLMVTKHCDCNT